MTQQGQIKFKRRPKNTAWAVFNPSGKVVGLSLDSVKHAWNDFYENYEGPDGWPYDFPDALIRTKTNQGYSCRKIKITL